MVLPSVADQKSPLTRLASIRGKAAANAAHQCKKIQGMSRCCNTRRWGTTKHVAMLGHSLGPGQSPLHGIFRHDRFPATPQQDLSSTEFDCFFWSPCQALLDASTAATMSLLSRWAPPRAPQVSHVLILSSLTFTLSGPSSTQESEVHTPSIHIFLYSRLLGSNRHYHNSVQQLCALSGGLRPS